MKIISRRPGTMLRLYNLRTYTHLHVYLHTWIQAHTHTHIRVYMRIYTFLLELKICLRTTFVDPGPFTLDLLPPSLLDLIPFWESLLLGIPPKDPFLESIEIPRYPSLAALKVGSTPIVFPLHPRRMWRIPFSRKPGALLSISYHKLAIIWRV